MDSKIRKTVFGNVGSFVSFRVGGEDANLVASEFNPRFTARDVINLGVRDFCIKMSINGDLKDAFSARTLSVKTPEKNYVKECIENSRANYARPLEEVQQILQQWEENKPLTTQITKSNNSNSGVAQVNSAPAATTQKPVVETPQQKVDLRSAPIDIEVDFEEPLI